jgi:hypothetical protein
VHIINPVNEEKMLTFVSENGKVPKVTRSVKKPHCGLNISEWQKDFTGTIQNDNLKSVIHCL